MNQANVCFQGLHSQTTYSLAVVGLDDIQPPNYAEPAILLQVPRPCLKICEGSLIRCVEARIWGTNDDVAPEWTGSRGLG